MKPLRQALVDYLSMRRALGFKLERTGQLLAQYVGYLESINATRITVASAVAWASAPANADRRWWAARLTTIRPFARYMSTLDAETEVPAADLLPAPCGRATAYLCSSDEITALLDAVTAMHASDLVAANYRTLIGLLAVTGMRVGEVIRLDRTDVDRDARVLLVRQSKFGKTRQIPLQRSTMDALDAYAKVRDRYCPHPRCPALLVSTTGTRLIYKNVHYFFHKVATRAGLPARPGTSGPRPHDLRHSFAINTLLDWYRSGADVTAKLPLLSTYLGHVSPTCTYWYLTATPELLAIAAQRLVTSLEPRQAS